MRRIIVPTILFAGSIGCASALNQTARADLAIPRFNADSVTTLVTGERRYALVGTLGDSASGKGIQGAIVSVRFNAIDRPPFALTNDAGGFVLGRLPAGSYELLVRRIGFIAFRATRVGIAGHIDTVRVRMQVATSTLFNDVVPP
ncbi:MAG: carboxypeptidase-like regulatory domain-containing protein [Gemmatimonadaceae bacterium]